LVKWGEVKALISFLLISKASYEAFIKDTFTREETQSKESGRLIQKWLNEKPAKEKFATVEIKLKNLNLQPLAIAKYFYQKGVFSHLFIQKSVFDKMTGSSDLDVMFTKVASVCRKNIISILEKVYQTHSEDDEETSTAELDLKELVIPSSKIREYRAEIDKALHSWSGKTIQALENDNECCLVKKDKISETRDNISRVFQAAEYPVE
ncbi:6832_t:CDS:2, partial [Funneliformis geosporum]